MNIFAHELAELLAEHDKELSSLYQLRSRTYQIYPNKVTRLMRSLEEDITATLNAEELDLLAEWLNLHPEGEEIRRLRAALVAESVRHLLGGRMNRDQALELGELTFHLLLGQEPEELAALRDRLLADIRGELSTGQVERRILLSAPGEETAPNAASIEQALEPAINMYEQGALWLGVAHETNERGTRLGYLAQAQALLSRAKDLATSAPTVAQGTPQQQEWLTIIAAALTEATFL